VCFELEQRRTLTSGDRTTIAVLAECVARWVVVKQELGTEFTITATITDKNGNTITTIKPNPLVKILEVCEARILSLQTALGLTPAARDRVRPTQLDAPTDESLSPGELYVRNIDSELHKPRILPMRPEENEDDESSVR
jgi:P27 family predicted phage terminase small subunit